MVWEPTADEIYLAKLKITSENKKGILADISAIMARKDANIIHAEIMTTTDKKGVSFFTIEVKNYNQLKEIIDAVKKVRDVLMVERISSINRSNEL